MMIVAWGDNGDGGLFRHDLISSIHVVFVPETGMHTVRVFGFEPEVMLMELGFKTRAKARKCAYEISSQVDRTEKAWAKERQQKDLAPHQPRGY